MDEMPHEYEAALDDLQEKVLETIALHEEFCDEPNCIEPVNMLAFIAHTIGIRSSGKCMGKFIELLHQYEQRCDHCKTGEFNEEPSSDWGQADDAVTEYWTWRATMHSTPLIVSVQTDETGDVRARRTGDVEWVPVEKVAEKWRGLFGPRVSMDCGARSEVTE